MSLDRGTARVPRVDLLRTKTLSIFSGSDERPHPLGGDEVAVELIQLRQPEIEAGVIAVGSVVRIAMEITEVLHQHKGAVEFGVVEIQIFRYLAQRLRPRGEITSVCRAAK